MEGRDDAERFPSMDAHSPAEGLAHTTGPYCKRLAVVADTEEDEPRVPVWDPRRRGFEQVNIT